VFTYIGGWEDRVEFTRRPLFTNSEFGLAESTAERTKFGKTQRVIGLVCCLESDELYSL
jgi:hypothetical protein